MNIERYKWPVIVAASLHGALLLSTPARPPVDRAIAPRIVDPGRTPPEFPVALRDPEESPAGETSGGASPLPSLPEIPAPAELRDVFTVPTIDRAAPDKPIPQLKIPTTGIGGEDGRENGKIGLPTMPRVADLDRTPRAMAQPPPDYPYGLRQAGVTGSVTIEFLVGIDGHVISAEAVRWTHRDFAEPAVRAVLRWKFEPGTINGRKVRFRMAVPIEFNATVP